MSSLHPARRSAERFNSLLQGEQGGAGARDAELLELVGALQTLPRVEARAEFVSDLRERLLLAAQTELVAPDPAQAVNDRLTVRTTKTPRERRLAVALGGFAIVGATTSMAVAAQTALPGDVLYPVKRAIENAETGFSVSDEAKGSTVLDNASGRLDEVRALTEEGGADADTVSQTLDTFADQANEASEYLIADYETTGSESSIDELRDFLADSIESLAALEEFIPPAAEDSLLAAAKTLFQIDAVVAAACPVCDDLGLENGIPIELLASGDADLDDEAIVAGADLAPAPAKPGKGKGNKPPIKTDPGAGTTLLPTDAPSTNLPGTGGTGKPPKNPVPSIDLNTAVPSIGVPEVDQIVEDVVQGVDDVLNGLTGGG